MIQNDFWFESEIQGCNGENYVKRSNDYLGAPIRLIFAIKSLNIQKISVCKKNRENFLKKTA